MIQLLDGCALSGLHSLRSSLDGCALSGLHSLRSSLDGCALSGLHSLRSSLDGCALSGLHSQPLTFLFWVAALLMATTDGFSQTESLSQGPYRIEILLERNDGDAWKTIDARTILDQGDRVRFSVRTNFSGYLYVTNQSTSGRYDVLFPGTETGRQNKIESGKSYVVPANEGWFRIAGPPGHEIIYWLVSPIELGGVEAPRPHAADTPAHTGDTAAPGAPAPPRKAPTLLPRCDNGIMRARGDCVDISAGPAKSPTKRRCRRISLESLTSSRAI